MHLFNSREPVVKPNVLCIGTEAELILKYLGHLIHQELNTDSIIILNTLKNDKSCDFLKIFLYVHFVKGHFQIIVCNYLLLCD